MRTWIEQELESSNFGDLRLRRRYCRIVEKLSQSPNSTVPEASRSWAATKATYNFWDSAKVSVERIIAPHLQATLKRAQGQKRILAVQDTSLFDWTHHPATTGLGCGGASYLHGIHVHSTLAVSTEGVPLGLLAQEQWTRPIEDHGKSANCKKRPVSDKESQKWLTALTATHKDIDTHVEIITCCDREADFWELFNAERPANSQLLIRAGQNRRVVDPDAQDNLLLFTQAHQAHCLGNMTVTIGHSGSRPARKALVTVKAMKIELMPPQTREKQPAIALTLVVAEEDHAPEDTTPIRWLLLTTLPIETFEDAVECVQYYSFRWLIERYHYTLKSGCQVESLQLETAQRLEKALATYCIVAWRLLWLLYHERSHPDDSCECVLETYQWQALYCSIHQTTQLPENTPTLQEATIWIARLGGFLARKGDGKPGVKTLWRGWKHLDDIAETWKLAKSLPNNTQGTYG